MALYDGTRDENREGFIFLGPWKQEWPRVQLGLALDFPEARIDSKPSAHDRPVPVSREAITSSRPRWGR